MWKLIQSSPDRFPIDFERNSLRFPLGKQWETCKDSFQDQQENCLESFWSLCQMCFKEFLSNSIGNLFTVFLVSFPIGNLREFIESCRNLCFHWYFWFFWSQCAKQLCFHCFFFVVLVLGQSQNKPTPMLCWLWPKTRKTKKKTMKTQLFGTLRPKKPKIQMKTQVSAAPEDLQSNFRLILKGIL